MKAFMQKVLRRGIVNGVCVLICSAVAVENGLDRDWGWMLGFISLAGINGLGAIEEYRKWQREKRRVWNEAFGEDEDDI